MLRLGIQDNLETTYLSGKKRDLLLFARRPGRIPHNSLGEIQKIKAADDGLAR